MIYSSPEKKKNLKCHNRHSTSFLQTRCRRCSRFLPSFIRM